MKKFLLMSLLFSLMLSSCAIFDCPEPGSKFTQSKIAVINNRDYFPAVHQLIDQAQKSVKLVVFQARYYLAFPGSTTNVLLLDLAQAAQRGVDVTVIVDASTWNIPSSESNRLTVELLKSRGVNVLYDNPEVTTHDKLLLIDDHYVVVGSTNWVHYALEKNTETNVIIDNPDIYQTFNQHFNDLLKTASQDYPIEIKSTPLHDPSLKRNDLIKV